MFNYAIRQAIDEFLAKTSCFIVVIVPLIGEMINRFRLMKPIDRPGPVDSQVFILDKQAVNWFNLKSSFSSFKPGES
jgi:hypothetical protein